MEGIFGHSWNKNEWLSKTLLMWKSVLQDTDWQYGTHLSESSLNLE